MSISTWCHHRRELIIDKLLTGKVPFAEMTRNTEVVIAVRAE
jgi:hypothetical protein